MVSTLTVRVDDLLWKKVPALYQRKPNKRVYVERLGDGNTTTIHFGDGVMGARLPSGQQNIRLEYRKGSGLEGQVKARQLTQLLSRPLGVKEVINPLPAEGADEPESLSDARQNAPCTVLTMERVVSLQDYEDFARAYSGVAKALATWTWDGHHRGVFLTVAGPDGAAIPAGGIVATGLLNSIQAAGDPYVPVRVGTYRKATFEIAGSVTVDADYVKKEVIGDVREALRSRFSFQARAFGQLVMLSEVIGVMQAVKGVVAIDIDHFQRTDKTEQDDPAPRLLADFPAGGTETNVNAAELLLLEPGNLEDIKVAS
jgi:predicted phage baseplate assembly protein